jgi:hypothetical protein
MDRSAKINGLQDNLLICKEIKNPEDRTFYDSIK